MDYREMDRAFEETCLCIQGTLHTQIGSYFNEEQFVGSLQVEVVCLNVVSIDTNCSLDVLFLQVRRGKRIISDVCK